MRVNGAQNRTQEPADVNCNRWTLHLLVSREISGLNIVFELHTVIRSTLFI